MIKPTPLLYCSTIPTQPNARAYLQPPHCSFLLLLLLLLLPVVESCDIEKSTTKPTLVWVAPPPLSSRLLLGAIPHPLLLLLLGVIVGHHPHHDNNNITDASLCGQCRIAGTSRTNQGIPSNHHSGCATDDANGTGGRPIHHWGGRFRCCYCR